MMLCSFVSFCNFPFLPQRSVFGVLPRWFIHLCFIDLNCCMLWHCEYTTIYNLSLLLMGTWVSNVSHCKRCHSDSSPACLQHTYTWLWAVCLGWNCWVGECVYLPIFHILSNFRRPGSCHFILPSEVRTGSSRFTPTLGTVKPVTGFNRWFF